MSPLPPCGGAGGGREFVVLLGFKDGDIFGRKSSLRGDIVVSGYGGKNSKQGNEMLHNRQVSE